MNPAAHPSPIDAAPLIDETLRRLGSVELRPGFESRLAARLAAAEATRAAKVVHFPFATRLGAAATAALAAAAMLLVSNDHAARQISLPPTARIAHGGFGPANAVHAPAQPLHATVQGRSAAHTSKGRAVLTPPQAHKAQGTAVPRSPFPAKSSSAPSPGNPPAQR